MKKEYIKPQMEVVKIQAMQILAGSPDAHDEVGGDGQLAPEFDWVEKNYQFGGWDVEWDEG